MVLIIGYLTNEIEMLVQNGNILRLLEDNSYAHLLVLHICFFIQNAMDNNNYNFK
jgi:hypothetical protein